MALRNISPKSPTFLAQGGTRLLAWGNNNQNLLSPSPSQCITRPTPIHIRHKVHKLTATEKHISYITQNGQVYSYGVNTDGRLGIGAKFKGNEKGNINDDRSSFKCWSDNSVKVQLPGKAVEIKSSFSHVLVKIEDGSIWAWGLGEYGSLGIGQLRSKSSPTKVQIPFQKRISSMSCGAMHSGFVDHDGNLYMCGSNEYGQLGISGSKASKSSQKIGTPTLVIPSSVRSVACGVFYTLVLTERGEVYGMGNNKYAQLGLGHKNSLSQSKPMLIQQLLGNKIVCIQAGYHSGALNSKGELFLWGSGSFGEVLRPKRFLVESGPLDMLQIRGFFGIARASTQYAPSRSRYHQQDSISGKNNSSRVYIWGNNTHGQLGNGGHVSNKNPTQVATLVGYDIVDIFCGINFVLAKLGDGHKRGQSCHQMNSSILKHSLLQSSGAQQSPFKRLQKQQQLQYQRQRQHNEIIVRSPRTVELSALSSTLQPLRQGDHNRYLSHHPNPTSTFSYNNSPNKNRNNKRYQQFQSQNEVMLQNSSRSRCDGSSAQWNSFKKIKQNHHYGVGEGQAQPLTTTFYRHQQQSRNQNNQNYDGYPQTSRQSQPQRETSPNNLLAGRRRSISPSRSPLKHDYQILFLSLSKDYEILAKQYKELQQQTTQKDRQQLERSRSRSRSRSRQVQLQYASTAAQTIRVQENHIQQLQRQLSTVKQDLTEALKSRSKLQDELGAVRLTLIEAQLELKQANFAQIDTYKTAEQIGIDTNSPSKRRWSPSLRNSQQQSPFRKLLRASPQKSALPSIQQLPSQSQATDRTAQKEIVQEYKKIIIEKDALNRQLAQQRQALFEQVKEQRLAAETNGAQLRKIEASYQDISLQVIQLKKMLMDYKERVKLLEEEKKRKTKRSEDNFRSSQSREDDQSQYKNDIAVLNQELKECRIKIAEMENKADFERGHQICAQKEALIQIEKERSSLYQIIENQKAQKYQAQAAYKQSTQAIASKTVQLEKKIQQLQIQLKFEKDYVSQLQKSKDELQKMRKESCQQLVRNNETLNKETSKRKQLESDLENNLQKEKLVESELQIVKDQIEKERSINEEYKDRMSKQYKKKQQLIRQMQQEIDAKEAEFDQKITKKEKEIQSLKVNNQQISKKMENQKAQVKKLNASLSLQKDECQNLKQEVAKLDRKLKHTKQQTDKQITQRQYLAQEVGQVKRGQTKMQIERENIQNQVDLLEKENDRLLAQIKRKQETIREAEAQIQTKSQNIQNLKQEINHMRLELEQANEAIEESNRVTEQLSRANRDFAQNQQNLTKKLQQVQAQVYELEDQNKSYAPRYEALLQRNRQLDRRNNELTSMVNKAIQIQAESYKSHILKQVEINTNQLIEQIQDERKFKQRFNRPVLIQEENAEDENSHSYINSDEQFDQRNRNRQNIMHQQRQRGAHKKVDQGSIKQEEPYTKIVNQKIHIHRKRVSQSAQKLADILDLNNNGESRGDQATRRQRTADKANRCHNDEKYEQINSQMDSLKNQKQIFMEKINSFATKMKLL